MDDVSSFADLKKNYELFKHQATWKHKYIHFELPGERERRMQKKTESRRKPLMDTPLSIFQEDELNKIAKEKEKQDRERRESKMITGDS